MGWYQGEIAQSHQRRRCDCFDFESKRMIANGKLFINSTSIGGRNLAGQFEVKEISGNKMVLTLSGSTYTFTKWR